MLSSKNKVAINDDASQSDIPPKYVLYSTRYIMLFLFAMSELCNTVVYATCNPIASEVNRYIYQLIELYSTTSSTVTLSATLYLFMHPIFTFPASYLIMNYGSASSIKLGSLLTLLGVGSRCLVEQGFVWVLVGQTLSGIGRPFVLNAQASVAVEWFPAEDRTKLMTFLNFMVTFSGILGYIVPPIFFAGYTVKEGETDPVILETGRDKFDILVISQALFCAVFLVPTIIFFKSKPASPPGPPLKTSAHQISFSKSISKMFKDIKFICIFLSFTLFYGTYKAYGVALVFILKPYGYGKNEIALLSCMPVIGGFVSSMFIPALYKKWGQYKPLSMGLEQFCMISFFGFIYSCYLENIYLMCLMAIIQGFFMIPAIPLLLEWGCEQIFPLNDSFCIGLMYSGATMGSSVIAQLLVLAIDGKNASKMQAFSGILIVCGLFVISSLVVIWITEVKHRLAQKKSFIQEQIEENFPHACPEGDPEDFKLFENEPKDDKLLADEQQQQK